MSEAMIQAVKTLARLAFGQAPSMTIWGETYAVITDGRIFVWDEAEQCLHLLIAIPLSDGSFRHVTVAENIRKRGDIQSAIAAADAILRDAASLPVGASQWGFEIEDLWLRICEQLGFSSPNNPLTDTRYRVRRGTPREDADEKADLVLEVRGGHGFVNMSYIPLQISSGTDGSPSKKEAISSGRVAYVAMRRFLPREQIEPILRAAATGDRMEVWLAGEILRSAISYYAHGPVILQKQASFYESDLLSPLYKEHYRRWLRPDIGQEIARINQGYKRQRDKRREIYQVIMAHRRLGTMMLSPERFR